MEAGPSVTAGEEKDAFEMSAPHDETDEHPTRAPLRGGTGVVPEQRSMTAGGLGDDSLPQPIVALVHGSSEGAVFRLWIF